MNTSSVGKLIEWFLWIMRAITLTSRSVHDEKVLVKWSTSNLLQVVAKLKHLNLPFYFEDFFSLNSVKILFVNTSVQFIILDSRVWFLIMDTSVRFFILSYLVTDRFVPSQLSRCVPCSVVSKVINLVFHVNNWRKDIASTRAV